MTTRPMHVLQDAAVEDLSRYASALHADGWNVGIELHHEPVPDEDRQVWSVALVITLPPLETARRILTRIA